MSFFCIKYRAGYENPKFRLTPGTWLGFLETKPNYQPGRYLSLALIFRRQGEEKRSKEIQNIEGTSAESQLVRTVYISHNLLHRTYRCVSWVTGQ